MSMKLDMIYMNIHTHRYKKGERPYMPPEYMSIKRPWKKAKRAAMFSLEIIDRYRIKSRTISKKWTPPMKMNMGVPIHIIP